MLSPDCLFSCRGTVFLTLVSLLDLLTSISHPDFQDPAVFRVELPLSIFLVWKPVYFSIRKSIMSCFATVFPLAFHAPAGQIQDSSRIFSIPLKIQEGKNMSGETRYIKECLKEDEIIQPSPYRH